MSLLRRSMKENGSEHLLIEIGRRICRGIVTLTRRSEVGRVSIVQKYWSGSHHGR